MHEYLREHSMTAWEEVQAGKPNLLAELISHDPEITHYLSADELHSFLMYPHTWEMRPVAPEKWLKLFEKLLKRYLSTNMNIQNQHTT